MLKIWPMLKSLLWKEFRELLPLIAVAIAAQVMWIAAILHFSDDGQHSVSSGWPVLYMITVLFAIAMGLWQMWRESLANHYQFLLHCPLDRSTIFISRIGFGAAAVMIVAGVPQLLVAIWADNLMEFRGTMAAPAWQLTAGVLLFYFGAALSVLRPGRWYGSRFLPLLAGILLFVVLQVSDSIVSYERMQHGYWQWVPSAPWFATIALALLLELAFVVAILHVARSRDYS
jgi:hypothetical protein